MYTRSGKGALGILVGLILVVLLGTVLGSAMMGTGWGGGIMGPGMMWGYGASAGPTATGGWPWAIGMGFGWLAMIAFWAAVILGIVLLVRWVVGAAPQETGGPKSEEPLTILRRRYATGEVDQETYERMKRELAA